jgi:hypothetical protein
MSMAAPNPSRRPGGAASPPVTAVEAMSRGAGGRVHAAATAIGAAVPLNLNPAGIGSAKLGS